MSNGARTNQQTMMQQPEYDAAKGGMDPGGVAASLERVAKVPARTWTWEDYLRVRTPTVAQVHAGLAEALNEGGGVATVNTIVQGSEGPYMHWVTVDAVAGSKVYIRDPQLPNPMSVEITHYGFGKYFWTGDTVVAKPSRQ